MPTGKTGTARGFTYLGLLFFVAITAAALAALGQRWSTATQRERERELEFRGREIARAIDSYLDAARNPPATYPRTLDDLLNDQRGIKPRHHLRRAYRDPFTGQADWVLIPATTGTPGFLGVHSRSDQELLKQISDAGIRAARAKDMNFLAGQAASTPASGASAPGFPASAPAPEIVPFVP